MRPFKTLVSIPITDSLRLIWSRITLSRLTIFYFLFSFLHASLQIILQAEVFSINSQATSLIDRIILAGDATTRGFSFLENNKLLWCHDPTNIPGSCDTLWTASNSSTKETDSSQYSTPVSYSASSMPYPSLMVTPSASVIVPTPKPTAPGINLSESEGDRDDDDALDAAEEVLGQLQEGVLSKRIKPILLSDFPGIPPNQTLSVQCLTALRWPQETLRNTKREDIVFLNFHVWVLGMSLVALLNESVVHMAATLVTHALLTAWSIFQILNTRAFQTNFNRVITHGACDGTHLLTSYWKERTLVEIPAAALNGAALLLSAFLTWRLILTYSWATFKRIGANRKVSKAYKLVLTFSVALQLSLFFIVVSMALWIDQLCNGAIGKFAIEMNLYRGIYITVLIFLVPWIVVGWRGVRKENRMLMAVFLGFDVLLIGGWASMFASTTFKLTFLQWRFFAIMSIVALVLTLSCLIFGIMCRLHFGNDLKRHLNGQKYLPDGFVSVMPGDRISTYSYEEKVAFPEATLPSFTRSSNGSDGGSSPSSLTRTDSANSASTISRPIIVPASRFSLDSNDAEAAERRNAAGEHKRNDSGSSGMSKTRRWIIE